MIYLIDDKTNRQGDYGWNEQKLSFYKDKLVFISRYDQIQNTEIKENILSDNNLILFHESFFSNVENKHNKDANEIRNKLVNQTSVKQNFKVIFFSGSYNSREQNETGGSIPVSVLYQNLGLFLEDYTESEKTDISILFFGKTPEIESMLINMRETCNSLLIKELEQGKLNSSKSNLVISGYGHGFPIPFTNSNNQTIFNKNISDEEINIKVHDWLSETEFDNIFIPICFGPTLSDYNGLRLATHIRCTSNKNQLKPIYIYSFVDYSNLIENEYFDILKTKNVFLIKYSKKAFEDAIVTINSQLTIVDLPKELKKINLQIPANYEDNHGIANEWAIYRWSQLTGANDKGIEKIIDIQNSNLYFKYLKTIYPISHLDRLESEKLKINFDGQANILYIDDEAEKGWKEIFETIFLDKNKNINFSCLDNELNEKTKDEICELALQKIKDEDIDLVILDFRLHKDDFENISIKEVTGYQILKKIKEHNKGIQVIIFSATNKIWNLEALKDAGADGFIMKESPENSNDPNCTIQSVLSLIKTIENRFNMIFLKKAYPIIEIIKSHLINISSDNGGRGLEEGLMKMKFKNELFIQLDIIYDCLEKSSLNISTTIEDQHSYLNLSFISIFKIIELINDFYTDEKGIVLKSNNTEIQTYHQVSNTFSSYTNQYPSTRDKIYTIIKYELNDEPKKFVNKLNQFINFRNNIIHPKTLKDYKKTTTNENLEFLTLVKSIVIRIQ